MSTFKLCNKVLQSFNNYTICSLFCVVPCPFLSSYSWLSLSRFKGSIHRQLCASDFLLVYRTTLTTSWFSCPVDTSVCKFLNLLKHSHRVIGFALYGIHIHSYIEVRGFSIAYIFYVMFIIFVVHKAAVYLYCAYSAA